MADEKWHKVREIFDDALRGGGIEQSFEVPEGVLNRALRWSPDGQSLLYIAHKGNVGNIWSLPLNRQPPVQVTNFAAQLLEDFASFPDGKRAIVTRSVKLSDIVALTVE